MLYAARVLHSRSLALLSLVALMLLGAPRARAQDASDEDLYAPPTGSRPTSGEASLLSGRTLGVGEVMLGAALGWPGLWAHLELAPSSDLNIGVRGGVVYGSPVMGLITGAGGELSVPIRIHVFGEGDIDVAVRVAPVLALGEGRLFGESQAGIFAADLGIASHLDVGARMAFRAVEHFTIFFGLDVGAGFSVIPDQGRPRPLGLFTAAFGVEALMTRDTMLFGEIQGGVGVSEPGTGGVAVYPQQEILRVALGLAYLL